MVKWNIPWMHLNTQERLLMNTEENFNIYIYRELLTFVDWFMATVAPPAVRHI
jgi:hypothetical protein